MVFVVFVGGWVLFSFSTSFTYSELMVDDRYVQFALQLCLLSVQSDV